MKGFIDMWLYFKTGSKITRKPANEKLELLIRFSPPCLNSLYFHISQSWSTIIFRKRIEEILYQLDMNQFNVYLFFHLPYDKMALPLDIVS